MRSLNIILRMPPYGTVDASEAIRHALGGVIEEMSVNLVLIDGGVNAARKGQDSTNTEYLSVEEGMRDCIDMGVRVLADKGSLMNESSEPQELIEGVCVISGSEIAELLRSADTTNGKRGVKLARDMAADVCFIQNAVYFAIKDRFDGFCGTVYLLDHDRRLRGIGDQSINKDIRTIDYDTLIALMIKEDKVIGAF